MNKLKISNLRYILGIRSFQIVWTVSSLNHMVRRSELLILSWFILERTNSPLQLALVWVFANLATPVIGPFSGFIADRFSRHHIMVLAQIINVLTSSIILLLFTFNLMQPWHIFTAFFFYGVSQFIEIPSRHTAILDIVQQERLVNAMSLEVIGHTGARLTGPLIGGILLDLLGYQASYLFVCVIHILDLILIYRVKLPPVSGIVAVESLWDSLKNASIYALHNPMIMGVLYISMIMNGLAFPVQQFIPAIGRDILGVGPTLVGLLSSSWGFGMLLFGTVMALTPHVQYHGRIFIAGSVLSFLVIPLFMWSPWYALSFAILIICGIGNAGFGTTQSPITMLSAPTEMRGRMIGVLIFFIGIGIPIGTLEIGFLAIAIGTQLAISVNAFVGFLLLIPALLFTPLLSQISLAPQYQRNLDDVQ